MSTHGLRDATFLDMLDDKAIHRACGRAVKIEWNYSKQTDGVACAECDIFWTNDYLRKLTHQQIAQRFAVEIVPKDSGETLVWDEDGKKAFARCVPSHKINGRNKVKF